MPGISVMPCGVAGSCFGIDIGDPNGNEPGSGIARETGDNGGINDSTALSVGKAGGRGDATGACFLTARAFCEAGAGGASAAGGARLGSSRGTTRS